jgi:putative colanic acid biosynthesis acetyltransferase WcaF
MNKQTDLKSYTTGDFKPGSNPVGRLLWYFTNVLFFLNPLNPSSGLKKFLLRLFGAKIGKGVVIKPNVNIKYPWKLKIGDYTWIGEKAWIDNLDEVIIGSNCCISQGAMLLCGNHNYRFTGFTLITDKIVLEDGAWVGAHAVVCPGVICSSHSVLAVNSVATRKLEAYTIYQGNPAQAVKNRIIQ